MTDQSNCHLLRWAGLASASFAVALVGCGKEGRSRRACTRGRIRRRAEPEPLKAAWVYVGPVGDAGWTFAHDQGRKAVEAEFGDKVIDHLRREGARGRRRRACDP